MNRTAAFAPRWLTALLLSVCACVAAPAASTASSPRAVLDQYCVGCHNGKLKAAGLALDTMNAKTPAEAPEVWEKVLRKVRARYMPPAGLPRPDEQTYDSFVSRLETSLDAAAATKPNPGRTDTFRRLNRTEYQNSIRDLLALDIDVASLLPSDESGHGFDNVTVGDLSATLLERYVSAARKISRLAIGSPSRSPGGDTFYLPPDLTQEDHFDESFRSARAVEWSFLTHSPGTPSTSFRFACSAIVMNTSKA